MVTNEQQQDRGGAKLRDHHQTGEPIQVSEDQESGEMVALGDHHQTGEPAR
ncbi:hypothetical protein [Streptomyces sp. JJ38]|uniref:hypothetical protein n=1 Tax=Streptomyces sp. JJ38 TaxID=2738128 RepID=UPI001C559973|nr:hypothetical protein [Streptomyces sp. JJ38]MBW1600367.1 hypothetical protein [Streptomyces sp. JJ38]